MTTKTRKNYTAEFKREAVRLITGEGYKASEAARSLDINANMLRRWIQKTRDESDSAFPGKGNLDLVKLFVTPKLSGFLHFQ